MEALRSSGTPLSYFPPPNELPYYDALFVTADHSNTGQLGGREAVNFLSRSKLPLELLKNIWGMADKPQTNTLDKNKFNVSVRLIQLYQNGQKALDSQLTCSNPAIRPPFFEGVTGVSVKPFDPPASVQHATVAPAPVMEQRPESIPMSPGRPPVPQVTSTLAVQDPYTMLPAEQSRYEALFPQYTKEDGHVHGKEAVELFSKSGLDKSTLRDIWNMVDDPIDNKLSKLEFAMAMHLIVCISKKGLKAPPSLPMSLKALKEPAKKPPMAMSTATGPPPLPPQVPQQQTKQQFISPAASLEVPPEQNSFQNPGNIATVPSGGDSVMGGASVMGGGASVISTGMSITDAFGDLNPEEVAKAGESYYKNTQEATVSTMQAPVQVSQPPPVQPINVSAVGQPEQNVIPTSQQPESYAYQQPIVENSFNAKATVMAAAPMPLMMSPVAENNLAPMPAPAVSKPSEGVQLSNAVGNDDKEKLEKMKSVLQKLQAENISLKAQLGQYTTEELQVRSDITKTIEEIGNMSQEVANLRVQVSDAKAALIEATAELKHKQEKKQETRSLIDDLGVAKETLNTALQNVNEINSTIDFTQPTNVVVPAPAPVPGGQVTNFFEIPAPSPAPVVNEVNNFDLMGGAVTTYPNNNHLNDPRNAPVNQSSILSNDDLSYQSLQQVFSSRTVEEVDELKEQAEKAAKAAQTADDHARALSMQLDNVKLAVEEAEKVAAEKQNASKGKKKGFGRGNKKAAKDAEAAMKDVSEVKKQYEETESERSAAVAEANALKEKANNLQEQAHQAEIELAQTASMMNSNATAPVPANSYDFSYMSTASSVKSTPSMSYVNNGNGHSNPDMVAVNYRGGSSGGVETTLNPQPSNVNAQPNRAVSNHENDYANPFGF